MLRLVFLDFVEIRDRLGRHVRVDAAVGAFESELLLGLPNEALVSLDNDRHGSSSWSLNFVYLLFESATWKYILSLRCSFPLLT